MKTFVLPGRVISGSTYKDGPKALQAQSDLTIAYTNAAGDGGAESVTADLAGHEGMQR